MSTGERVKDGADGGIGGVLLLLLLLMLLLALFLLCSGGVGGGGGGIVVASGGCSGGSGVASAVADAIVVVFSHGDNLVNVCKTSSNESVNNKIGSIITNLNYQKQNARARRKAHNTETTLVREGSCVASCPAPPYRDGEEGFTART